jgi:hypothetical protein
LFDERLLFTRFPSDLSATDQYYPYVFSGTFTDRLHRKLPLVVDWGRGVVKKDEHFVKRHLELTGKMGEKLTENYLVKETRSCINFSPLHLALFVPGLSLLINPMVTDFTFLL